MAFNFNAIDSVLDDGDQKLNMFETPVTASNGGGTASGSNQISGSSSGFSSGNAQPASSAPPPPKGVGAFAGTNPAAAAQAYRGLGNVDTTKERGRVQGDIAGANAKLQAEANSYAQKAQNTAAGYSVDSDTLKKAADGDAEALSKTQQRLTATAPSEFEAFGGLKADEIPTSANVLKSKDTWGDLFHGSADYGRGEKNLQGMLLRMNGFQPEANKLIGEQDKLIKDNDAAVVDKTKSTREQLEKNYADATGQARGELKGMSDQISADAKVKADAEAVRRAGLDPAKLSAEEFKKIADDLRTDFQGSTGTLGRSLGYLDNPDDFDMSSYVNVDRDVSPDEFLSKEEVDRFNRINGLLGNSDLKTFQSLGAGSDYSFDKAGAAERIRAILEGKRGVEDTRIHGLMDQIQGTAEQRRLADDPAANIRKALQEKYLDQNEGQSRVQMQAEKNAFDKVFEGQTFSPKASWQQMLTAEEADQLNQYAKELGIDSSYAASSDDAIDPWDKRFQDIYNQLMAPTPQVDDPVDTSTSADPRVNKDILWNPIVQTKVADPNNAYKEAKNLVNQAKKIKVKW